MTRKYKRKIDHPILKKNLELFLRSLRGLPRIVLQRMIRRGNPIGKNRTTVVQGHTRNLKKRDTEDGEGGEDND